MSRYQNPKYTDLERWSSFWHQIREVLELDPETILEIGTGNKTVYNYFKVLGKQVSSLDIDPETEPDRLGSVENIPFPDKSFDLVLCAEVLEHLPFEKFQSNLREIKRVTKKSAVLTLPHWGRHFSVEVRLPFLKRIRWQHKFSLIPVRQETGGEHFWEIGKRGYSLRKVRSAITSSGFEIKKDYVIFEMPYHHVFVLEVKD